MPSAPILNRVPPEHRQKLLTPVGAEARSVLAQMGANKLMRPVMSVETQSELIAAGYGRETLGGFALSDVGQVRAMMEATPQ